MALLSHVLQNGTLIEKTAWQQHVKSLHVPVSAFSMEDAAAAVLQSLQNAVLRRVPDGPFGVLLSGGLDSSLIAKILKDAGREFSCFVVGLPNAPDIAYAKKAAVAMQLQLNVKELTTLEVHEAAAIVAQLLQETENTVKVEIGATAYAALSFAKSHGCAAVFTGLGAEEIFGGYQRHLTVEDVNAECWRGLADDLWEKDLTRDAAIAAALHVQPLLPFLDEKTIQAAMKVPGNLKVRNGERKLVLRRSAELAGLPPELAWRRKMAIQYGSRVSQSLTGIASARGLQKRAYLRQVVAENSKF